MSQPVWPRIACAWARAMLPEGGALRRPGSRWIARHLRSCPDCAHLAAALAQVETGLAVEAGRARPSPPAALRERVLDAAERASRARRAPARSRLDRALWATGALASLALIGALAWSRRDAWSTPPRTVRISLPAGVVLGEPPTIVIRRADGSTEPR